VNCRLGEVWLCRIPWSEFDAGNVVIPVNGSGKIRSLSLRLVEQTHNIRDAYLYDLSTGVAVVFC